MNRKNKLNVLSGFTLIELLISMALISIVIVILVQTSGVFNDRLLMIQKRIESKIALMQLALYLGSLKGVINVSTMCNHHNDPNQISTPTEISCSFYSGPNGTEKVLPIFPLSKYGFVSAEWGTSTDHGVTRHFLLLKDSKLQKVKVHYGIFPGVTYLR